MTSAETWSAYLAAMVLLAVGFSARQLGAYELAQGCAFVALMMFGLI